MNDSFHKRGAVAGKRIASVTLAVAATAATLLVSGVLVRPAAAEQAAALPKVTIEVPRDVLIFPATVDSAGGEAAANSPASRALPMVTEAFRNYLSHSGIGVVVYSKRLPSIERAVAEGQVKAEEAAAGPGDDPRNALRFAQTVGAQEYLTVEVQNYKYDANTRTATFNVSVYRNSSEDNGAPLSTVAKPAVGTAPADMMPNRQEASAVTHAADQVAEECFQDLYPKIAQLREAERMKAAKDTKDTKKK